MVHVVALGQSSALALPFFHCGKLYLTVAVKASFAIGEGGALTRAAAPGVAESDSHERGFALASVRTPSDRVPRRTRVDALLTGHAIAPGAPVTELEVRFALERAGALLIDKRARVRADDAGGTPQAFTTMPLGYERAFGGIGCADNPIGTGARAGDKPPNLVHPTEPGQAVGFGPLSIAWPSRRKRMGKLTSRALAAPVVELPDDVDWLCFQTAPDDQQLDRLDGSEVLLVAGCHRAGALRIALPKARAIAVLYGIRGDIPSPIELAIDLVHVDSDAATLTLGWRGSADVPNRAVLDALSVVAGVVLPGERLELPTRAPNPEHAAEVARAQADGALVSVGGDELVTLPPDVAFTLSPSSAVVTLEPDALTTLAPEPVVELADDALMTLTDVPAPPPQTARATVAFPVVSAASPPGAATMVLPDELMHPKGSRSVAPSARSAPSAATVVWEVPPSASAAAISPAAVPVPAPAPAPPVAARATLPLSDAPRPASADTELERAMLERRPPPRGRPAMPAVLPGAPWASEAAKEVPAPAKHQVATLSLHAEAAAAAAAPPEPQRGTDRSEPVREPEKEPEKPRPVLHQPAPWAAGPKVESPEELAAAATRAAARKSNKKPNLLKALYGAFETEDDD